MRAIATGFAPGHRSSSIWWLTSNGRGAAEGLNDRSGGAEYGRTTVRLLEVDRALAATLDEPSRVDAKRGGVDVLAVAPGEWTSSCATPSGGADWACS